MDSRSLRTTPSQETLISLLQLEPTPIDQDKELPALPEDAREDGASWPLASSAAATSTDKSLEPGHGYGYAHGHARTTSLGLSGSNGGAVYYLTRIQRWSTYALSIFTGIHLANTSVIPLFTRSVPASESYLLLAREIYHTSLTEPLFVALPIAAHVASGVALRFVRRAQNLKRYGGATPAVLPQKSSTSSSSSSSSFATTHHRQAPRSPWPQMSVISLSGYGFTAFLSAHVFMNRLLPLHVEGDSANIGLAYVAHGFARHPATAYVAFGGLLALGCGHMVWGWAKWIGLAQLAGWRADLKSLGSTRNKEEDVRRRKRRRRIWLWVNGTAVAATALWAAGGLGVVARGGLMHGWVGNVYDEMYATVGMH